MITTQELRDLSGAPESLITDTQINSFLTLVREKVKTVLRIVTTPTTNMEIIPILDPTNIQVNNSPLLSIISLNVNDTNYNLNEIHFRRSGTIFKDGGDFYNYSSSSRKYKAKVKYIYGYVEEDTQTVQFIDTNVSSGTSTITLNDATNYRVNDWISIEDFNGFKEIVEINSISNNDITVTLQNSYSGDIKITTLIEPKIIEEFVKYETCMAIALNAIGNTYTFNTSYSKGGASFNKGVPYPHWEKSFNTNQKLRDEIRGIIFDSLTIVA